MQHSVNYSLFLDDGVEEFTTTMESFIEASTLGEFSVRLQLIDLFMSDLSARGQVFFQLK